MSHLDRPDLAGTVLGDFELVKQIGRGHSGDVYEAVYRPNGKLFALKLLDVDATADTRRRFRSEFKVLSTLEIKGLVAAYHFGELADGRLFFTTDLLPGQNFERYLRTHRDTRPDRALAWTLQIAEVISTLHAEGVLHRDLKPGNIQIDAQGELTVYDLGSCKCTPVFYAETERRYITGPEDRHITGASERRNLCTAGYLAPEATRSEPSASLDIFSIGAILHRILFGHTPDCTYPEIVDARSALQPDELRDVLECAIAEEPADRYQSLTTLIRELDLALEMVRLELGIEPEVGQVDDASDQPPAIPPSPAVPHRSHWLRNTAALGLMFTLGWSFAQVDDNPAATQPTAAQVDASRPNLRVPDIVEQPSQSTQQARTKEVDESCQTTPAEPAESKLDKLDEAAGQAPSSDHQIPAVKPSPVRTGAAKAKRTFTQDLRTRMESCQFPSQSVTFAIRDGKIDQLTFAQPPGSVQRTCVMEGLAKRYGDHDFSGQLVFRGGTP